MPDATRHRIAIGVQREWPAVVPSAVAYSGELPESAVVKRAG
ncbi:hypothetical protein [Bosea sp. AAP35]|nr:hypothetical protein [Bosea sp. AAP35]